MGGSQADEREVRFSDQPHRPLGEWEGMISATSRLLGKEGEISESALGILRVQGAIFSLSRPHSVGFWNFGHPARGAMSLLLRQHPGEFERLAGPAQKKFRVRVTVISTEGRTSE